MEYFRLRQDGDFSKAPLIPNPIAKIDWRHVMAGRGEQIDEVTIFQLSEKIMPDCIDLLDRQLLLVSELLREVIKMYVPKLEWKIVVLANAVEKWQQPYYLPVFQPVDCMSEASVTTPDKSMVKHLVLKESEIKNQTIFRVKHHRETIIAARLDAAESILRRSPRGVKVTRIETI